jgi:hypothetical protein
VKRASAHYCRKLTKQLRIAQSLTQRPQRHGFTKSDDWEELARNTNPNSNRGLSRNVHSRNRVSRSELLSVEERDKDRPCLQNRAFELRFDPTKRLVVQSLVFPLPAAPVITTAFQSRFSVSFSLNRFKLLRTANTISFLAFSLSRRSQCADSLFEHGLCFIRLPLIFLIVSRRRRARSSPRIGSA